MTISNNRIKVISDNIIFSLQHAGGISVVWYELLNRLLADPEITSNFIEYPNCNNIFRKNLPIQDSTILKYHKYIYPLLVQRYLNPQIKDNGIFHSSYYRTTNSKNIANITTVHDFTYEYYRTGLSRLIHHKQKGDAIKNSKRIICVSENTKKDLLEYYPKIKEEKIKVIYNGVDCVYQPLVKNDSIFIKQLIPFSSGEFVLYIGDRKSSYKNFNLASKACKISKLPLVMVGGGILSDKENKFLTETLGVNNFKLLNGISNEQLNLIYNHALCLLYPSLYEGFGIPILEAQRAGCPVISTNFSSIPEVAGKGAILLDDITEYKIAEAINAIIKDSNFVDTIIKEGYKNSQTYSWDKCYQQTKELYKEVYEEYF